MGIKGVVVILYEKQQTGVDDFNNPIYEEIGVEVPNVIFAPTSASDITDRTRLNGTSEMYTLAIPKGDTHQWLHNIVEFDGKKWNCYAETVGIEDMIPLAWNKKVMVERYEN